MQIKTQIRIFLLGIILIPVLFFPALFTYHRLKSPDKLLFTGSRLVNDNFPTDFSETGIQKLKNLIKHLPLNSESILISDHKDVLFSTMPGFKTGDQVDFSEILNSIRSSSQDYIYQIMRPSLDNSSSDFIFIIRISNDFKYHPHNRFEKRLYILLIFIFVFECFCITVVIHLSRTISKSITLLDSNTQKIAGGELDTKLDYDKNPKKTNEIIRLNENLEKMRLALKDNTERRTRFIMGISHDLRTPVSVIKGYSEAMADGLYSSQEDMKKALDIIISRTDQLDSMINTLINFVKLNQSEWAQLLQPQKLKPFLLDFAETSITTGQIFKRNVSASINIQDDFTTAFDRELLQRTLENLYSNAIRYTNENDSIIISAEQTPNAVTLSLKDTGIGISSKDINKIFDIFYRGSPSRREEGLGIGLSIVKTIINSHGWKIDVYSEESKGTEFLITIPVKPEAD